MDFSSAVRTARVFTWVSIVWLGLTVCRGIQIHTTSRVTGQCGQNVQLTCEVSGSQKLDIKMFDWLGESGSVWKWSRCKIVPELECEPREEDGFHYRLTLTLVSLKPIDAGNYTCKLHSAQGIRASRTTVEVEECRGNVSHSRNASHAECSFRDVYPSGVVHWFQGESNLTDSCTTEQRMDQHGLYDISSVIHLKKENLKQLYNCSLWIPSVGRYHSWMQVPSVRSSQSAAGLKRIYLVLEIILLKLIM